MKEIRKVDGNMAEEKKNEAPVKRGRGRPKGTGGNKLPSKSEEKSVHTEPGDNTKYLNHSLKMFRWKEPDMTNLDAVNNRIDAYFSLCAEDDMKPSVAGLALAFGVDRRTIWKWSVGQDCKYISNSVRDSIKKAYQILNSQMEDYMQNGKINPVAGIFLMKNNMGYKDQQDVVLKPDNPLGEVKDAKQLQDQYVEYVGKGEIISDSDESD